MDEPTSIDDALSTLTRAMQASLSGGQADHFRELAKQRNRLLQWVCGLLKDERLSTLHGSGASPLSRDRRDSIIRRAIAENQSFIVSGRTFLTETRAKIDQLTRQRQFTSKLTGGYRLGARSGAVYTRL